MFSKTQFSQILIDAKYSLYLITTTSVTFVEKNEFSFFLIFIYCYSIEAVATIERSVSDLLVIVTNKT